MGIIELIQEERAVKLHAIIFIYGNAADAVLAAIMQENINDQWNKPQATVSIKGALYSFEMKVQCHYTPDLRPEDIFHNKNPLHNYFRIEEFALGNISFVDGLGSNTGYFKLENLLHHSTTASHEFGHTLGLDHPLSLDIRGHGVPGIMYPRGTIVDPEYQYNPQAAPATNGGTLNPFLREVLQADVDLLRLQEYNYRDNKAIIGDFSSVWHEAHAPS